MDSLLSTAAIALGALVLLGVMIYFALHAFRMGEIEDALFARAKALGFRVEEHGTELVRGQLPLLGIPIDHAYDPLEVGVPRRSVFGGTYMAHDPDPRMRETRTQTYRRFPVAIREDPQESLMVFLMPHRLRRPDGSTRDHDPLVLAINPRASPLVGAVDPQQRAAVEAETGMTVEVQGAWLLVYRAEAGAPPPFDEFLERALATAHRFV